MRLRLILCVAAVLVGATYGTVKWVSDHPKPTKPDTSASKDTTVATDVITAKIICGNGTVKAKPKRIEYGLYPALSKDIERVDYTLPYINIATAVVINNPPDPEHRIIGSCGDLPFMTNFTRLRSYTVNCIFQGGGTICKPPS